MIVAPEIRAASEALDHKIGQAKGLSGALNALANEYCGLNNPEPAAHNIMVLLDLLDDVASELWDLNQTMWHAVVNAGKSIEV
jgi:hypothetical protein